MKTRMNTSNAPSPAALLMRRAGYAALTSLAMTNAASAGIVDPGGDSHNWLGAVNNNWNVSGNWTGAAVPADGDSAVINGGPFPSITMIADSAHLDSLFLTGGTTLFNSQNRLRVTQGIAETTISGAASRLFISPTFGGTPGLVTDTLLVPNSGRVQLSGGEIVVNDQLTLSSGGSIFGSGRIEVDSPNSPAFNGFTGSAIITSNANLEIVVSGGGSIILPPLLNIEDANSSLTIDAPFFTDVQNIHMGESTQLDIADPWTLAGELLADPTPAQSATVTGSDLTVEGQVQAQSGELIFDAYAAFSAGSTMDVFTDSAVVLGARHTSVAGQSTEVFGDGVLRIDGLQALGDTWQGDIALTGGALQINNPQLGGWGMGGQIQMSSVFGPRALVEGDATLILSGDLIVDDFGGDFTTDVDLRSTSTTQLVNTFSRLNVFESLLIRNGADVQGDGWIDVANTGALSIAAPSNIDVDITNAGLFDIHSFNDDVAYLYIDGTYSQEPTGTLSVQIAGPNSMEYDVYETSGDVSLAGDIAVGLLDGYVPQIGDEFEFFFVNGILSGTFDAIVGDSGFSVSYTSNSVVLTFNGNCAADLTGDNAVDSSDLAMLLAAWGGPSADLNGDGVTNSADLALLLVAWGVCP